MRQTIESKTLDQIRTEFIKSLSAMDWDRRKRLRRRYSEDLYSFGYMAFDPQKRFAIGVSHNYDDELPGYELEEARFKAMNRMFFKGHQDAKEDHRNGLI